MALRLDLISILACAFVTPICTHIPIVKDEPALEIEYPESTISFTSCINISDLLLWEGNGRYSDVFLNLCQTIISHLYLGTNFPFSIPSPIQLLKRFLAEGVDPHHSKFCIYKERPHSQNVCATSWQLH